ncbi:uncharacterized protein [Leuresthes tenuis]|uniref:uncharacterized protein isoform X2 n=1 Tax=Leuresthes tenuis TaxID=355514 RepID=UPI003B50B148
MMDNLTGNKSHVPCQTWAGQTGWSTTLSQGLVINQHTNSQQLSLGSSSEQSPLYNLLQASNQSCMNNMSTLPSRNNNHDSSLYKFSPISNISSSNSLFDNTAIPSTSHVMSFAQQSPHSSAMLIASNQEKTVPPPSLLQPNQGPQPCRPQHLPFLSPNNPQKALFQMQLPCQGLPDGLQVPSMSLPSCGQHRDATQATFGGQNVKSTGVAVYSHSYASSPSQDQPQWVPPSLSRGAVNRSVPDATVPQNKQPAQKGNIPNSSTLATNDERRSIILQQRAQLLEQLENMNKLLESMPPDANNDDQWPHTAVKGDPHPCKPTETSDPHQVQLPSEESASRSSPSFYDEKNQMTDTPEEQMSAAESMEKDDSCCDSADDTDPDYMPRSDGSLSDCQSKDTVSSGDHASDSRPQSPTDETQPLAKTKRDISSDSSSEEESATPPENMCKSSQIKSAETVVLPVSNTKARRVYDRKNYCLFCTKPVSKMARHLERVHSDRAEVALAFQYPVFSKERQKIWNKLTNEGNFAHNKNVLKTGKGQLAVRKRPKKTLKAEDYIHCIYCLGLYGKKAMYRHLSKCPDRVKKEGEDESQEGRKRIISRCVLLTVDLGISESVRNILCEMIYDDVTRTVMNNRIILQFAEQMFNEYGKDVKKHGYIRQNIRQIARLLLEAQKMTPMESLEDFFYPSNFRHVVSAVNVVAGYDPEKKAYSAPSLAIKLGYILQKICCIIEGNANESGDVKVAEAARNFLSVYQKKWNKRISSSALTNLKEIKQKKEKKMPFAQDVKRLHFHLESVHRLAEKKLAESYCAENYAALARVVLARLIVFNRRKTKEVASIQITAFMSRKRSDVLDDMDLCVSDLERTLCGIFTRVDIRGSSGRMVPVLLKPCFESSIELLINARKACGVSSNNPFIFGRPTALSAYNGSECIQRFANECGAEHPAELTSVKIRRHFAAMLQLINLDEDEARQIFGPNNQIHVLRQNDNMMFDDTGMEPGVSLQLAEGREANTRNHDEVSSTSCGAAGLPAYGGKTSCSMTTLHKSDKLRAQDSTKAKLKWDEEEVRAVEKHLMSFIKEGRVPQKNDCVQCLEAESHALRARTWRGVKDYVRNRITTLQRQRGSFKKPSKSCKRPRQEEPQQRTDSTKLKWDEEEVCAVERHLMSFIKEHEVPQKNDCVQCLEAEPHALRARSWKGVKDYVRNRITTLQRQREKGSFKKSSERGKRPRRVEPQQRTDSTKAKLKWDEEEVRAVEKHLMSFIKEGRVPQKNDCVQCLEAESHALKARTWKGVKDYVRNRITTLQRQRGSFSENCKSLWLEGDYQQL